MANGNLVLTPENPAISYEIEQPQAYSNLILEIESSLTLAQGGEVLLSIAINGATAIQVSASRRGRDFRATALTIVDGFREFRGNGQRLSLDLRNSAQLSSVSPGRGFVTVRVDRGESFTEGSYSWTIKRSSRLTWTDANPEELGLEIVHDGVRFMRDENILTVPVKVTRRGGWSATPLRVAVHIGNLSAEVVVAKDQDNAEVEFASSLDLPAGPTVVIEASVVGAFNEPRNYSVADISQTDRGMFGFGSALGVAGMLWLLVRVFRGSGTKVVPLALVALGAAVLLWNGQHVYSLKAHAPSYEEASVRETPDSKVPTVLNRKQDARFVRSIERDKAAVELLGECRPVILEEFGGAKPVRIYELSPQVGPRSLRCSTLMAEVVGPVRNSGDRENRALGVFRVSTAGSSEVDWKWGYPLRGRQSE